MDSQNPPTSEKPNVSSQDPPTTKKSEAQLPVNVTRKPGDQAWKNASYVSAFAWLWSLAVIGVTANAIARFTKIRKYVEALDPTQIEFDAEGLPILLLISHNSHIFLGVDIMPTVVIILILTCIMSVFLFGTFTWLYFNTPNDRAEGFFTSAASLYIPTTAIFLMSWLLFADLILFSEFFRSRSAQIHTVVDDIDVIINRDFVAELAAIYGVSFAYRTWGFLRSVAVVSWLFWLFTLIASIMLGMSATDGNSIPDITTTFKPDAEAQARSSAPTTSRSNTAMIATEKKPDTPIRSTVVMPGPKDPEPETVARDSHDSHDSNDTPVVVPDMPGSRRGFTPEPGIN
ncbi:hypothetical protein FA15DRAFT_444600 [Coprinopsis marcescibilis]|uniref:Uncharacterized protein n=1 Tax=Coprinopsis marcescibilis TaxID=230819 RepID=A0A5C3KU81_COPMA|nr:hypothetical protein FA15DRAFT_444600 [Coprinopsis marcescibilis]